MAKDYKAFMDRMENDFEFANAVKAKAKDIAEKESISDEKETAVRAGKEMGYEFTIGDIERNFAFDQELDDVELSKIAGGDIFDDIARTIGNWCFNGAYSCISSTITD